jgi:polyferredoxin
MDTLGKPRGLIRYSSQAVIERGEKLRLLRPRVVLYPLFLCVIATLLIVTFAGKGNADVLITRMAGNPFVRVSGGDIANSLRLKVTNRTAAPAAYEISVEGTDKARVIAPENPLKVAAGESRTEPFTVVADPTLFKGGSVIVTLRIATIGEKKEIIRDVPMKLLGPGGGIAGVKNDW